MNHVDSHRKRVSLLKTQFDELEREVTGKLKECGECIESAERLNQEAESLVSSLKDALAHLPKDVNEWQQIKEKLATTAVNTKVTLDVGGKKYKTSVATLTREKNTFFTAMFSQQWQLERDPKDDSIFIDRDGELFSHILAYLRTEVVPNDLVKVESMRQKLITEAEYFHLHKLIEILRQFDQSPVPFLSDGTLLSNEQEKILFDFCGKTYTNSQLLYKASRDGFDVNAFQNRYNNQTPTIIIIRSNNGYLFGAYTCVPWNSNDANVGNDDAFLFTLTNPHNIPPTKYPLQPSEKQHAVSYTSNDGPKSNGEHRIHICSNSNSLNDSYINFPHTYADSTGQGNNIFTGNRNFLTTDIEVFKLM